MTTKPAKAERSIRASHMMYAMGVIGLLSLALAGIGALAGWAPHWLGMLTGLGVGFTLAAVLWRLQPRWWRESQDQEFASPAGRRYMRRMWLAMGCYVLLLTGSLLLLKQIPDPQWLRGLVAVSPVVGMLLFARAMLHYLREVDELQRRIETDAIATAAAVVPLLYFAAGFLQLAKVIDVPSGVAMIWVFPLTCGTYGVAKFLAARRYR